MSDIDVDLDALRNHASKLMTVHERFGAVVQASANIFQADEAYGQLCQFLPPVLEERHQDQDEAVDALAENIELLAEAIRSCADEYETADEAAQDSFDQFNTEL